MDKPSSLHPGQPHSKAAADSVKPLQRLPDRPEPGSYSPKAAADSVKPLQQGSRCSLVTPRAGFSTSASNWHNGKPSAPHPSGFRQRVLSATPAPGLPSAARGGTSSERYRGVGASLPRGN